MRSSTPRSVSCSALRQRGRSDRSWSRNLLLAHGPDEASVDDEIVTVDEAGFVRGEVEGGAGNVVGESRTRDWCGMREVTLDLGLAAPVLLVAQEVRDPRPAPEDRRGDRPRRDRVDADLVGTEFDRR